jgi:UPF0297 protein CD1283
MEEKKDFTMMFKKGKKPEILSKEETIKQVVKALEEKKYNVVDQLTGYLLSGDPTYITSHNNARNLITTYEREDLLEEIVSFYLKKK